MEFMKFNLNQYFKVKIKAEGYIHLGNKMKAIGLPQYDAEYFMSKADSKGYTKMQAHEFLSDFGAEGFHLCRLIDINILIEKQ